MSSTAESPPGSWGRALSELHSAFQRKAPSEQGVVCMPFLYWLCSPLTRRHPHDSILRAYHSAWHAAGAHSLFAG